MVRLYSSSSLRLGQRLCILGLVALASARPHPQMVQKRDIFSDIGNFFDNLGMQVEMDIFQPIENFFVTTADEIANFITSSAEDFFMQAQTVIASATYNFDMLVSDVANAIESDVIDEANTIANFASQIGQEIATDTENAFNAVSNEFNNVIGPAIANGLNVAGGDILSGLETAGNYIEAHPELIAEVFLTVALGALTIVQPELIGADAALIGEVASEAAAETATEVAVNIGAEAGTEIGVETGANTIVDSTAQSIVDAAAQPLGETIQSGLDDDEEPIYNTIQSILDMASQNGLSSTDDLGPIDQETLQQVQDQVSMIEEEPIYNNLEEFWNGGSEGTVYNNLPQVVQTLEDNGLVVGGSAPALAKRNPAVVKARNKKSTKSSSIHSTSSPTKGTSSTQKPSSTTEPSSTMITRTSSQIPQSTGSLSHTSTTATISHGASTTYVPQPIPSAQVAQWVQYHWLNRTMGGKNFTSALLRSKLKNQLTSSNMTSTSIMTSVPNALQSKGLTNITYPPTADAHRMAIAHQIASGNATAYSKNNSTVKIVLNANAPVDPCLGLPVLPCFGNEIFDPYCLNDCGSRWYNKQNVQVEHW